MGISHPLNSYICRIPSQIVKITCTPRCCLTDKVVKCHSACLAGEYLAEILDFVEFVRQ